MDHSSLPVAETAALTAQAHVRVVPTKITGQLQIAPETEMSTNISRGLFGTPKNASVARNVSPDTVRSAPFPTPLNPAASIGARHNPLPPTITREVEPWLTELGAFGISGA